MRRYVTTCSRPGDRFISRSSSHETQSSPRPRRPLSRRRRPLDDRSRRLRGWSRWPHGATDTHPDAYARPHPYARSQRSARGQRLREAVSAPDLPAERESPLEGQGLLDGRRDTPRGPQWRVLPLHRLHGRSHDLPTAARGVGGAGRVRGVAGRDRQGHGDAGADLDLHRIRHREGQLLQQRAGRAVRPPPERAIHRQGVPGGLYQVCTEAGACAAVDVDRNL